MRVLCDGYSPPITSHAAAGIQDRGAQASLVCGGCELDVYVAIRAASEATRISAQTREAGRR